MTEKFKVEILKDWDEASKIKDQWDALNLRSGIPHPFTSCEWFDCWYHAYCKPGQVRIVLVRDGQGLRAILPGMVCRDTIKGVPLNIFTYAANGYSPRADIIATPGDTAAFLSGIRAISTHLPEKIHLIKLWMVQAASPTDEIINASELPYLSAYCEHSAESPGFDLSDGWDKFFQGRSKKFRFRFRQAENRAKRLGDLGFEVFTSPEDLSKILPRLKSLDAKTWQHQNGSGLFSTLENAAFYQGLLVKYSEKGEVVTAFLKIGEADAAYEIGVISRGKGFFLKYGYDPLFADCRPGVLVQSYLTQFAASRGVDEIDLGLEQSAEKAHWQTKAPEYRNYWLIGKNTLKGRGLLLGIAINERLKKVKGLKNQNAPNDEND